MVEISTISLRELNRLIKVLHESDEDAGATAWRRSVLEVLLSVLGAREAVFVATWDAEPLVWAKREEGRLVMGSSSDSGRLSGAWSELATLGEGEVSSPDFRAMVDHGKRLQSRGDGRRWEEFLGCVVFRKHEDGELSWLGTFGFDEPPSQVAENILPLLRILSPAFEAGTEGFRRGNLHHQRLRTLVEAFGEPAVLVRSDGDQRQENRALKALLRNEPEADRLSSMLSDLKNVESPVTMKLQLSRSDYLLSAAPLDPGHEAPGRWVLIRIESSSPVLPGPRELSDRFSLTEREAEVAIFLARGLSTKAVARELEISWHTARRHVENTLKKLEISSRAKVMDRLLTRS